MGPLGRGFTPPEPGVIPVAVAGGYGAAAMYMLSRKSRGVLLMGARSAADVILTERYRDAGYDVRVATNDGSVGHKGFVTELLAGALEGHDKSKCLVCGCGPTPMLLALGKLTLEQKIRAELSLDQHMCCGVGACFACVVNIKDPASPDGWRYSRSCKEGPVYNATEVYYG